MTWAKTRPLRVRGRRTRRSALAKIVRGAGMLAIVGIAVLAVGAGAAHLFAAATTARAQLKPVLALGATPEPAMRRAVNGAAQHAIIASLKLPEPRIHVPVVAMALANEERFEPEVTGSVSAPAQPVAPRVIAVAPVSIPRAEPLPKSIGVASRTTLDDATPLPRVRPQFASLAPPDNPLRKEQDQIGQRTAIYDITAQAVYLPSGEKLEAHSGYGPFMDDPRNVHRKMRGSTPPNAYKLTLREALFHGVQAIRMTPENEGAMHGRDGILAHSFLLGPSGQSHGCVSFRDYPKFLAAFQRGEIERMVVVARLAQPPAMYARRNTRSAHAAVGGPHDAVR